MSQNFNQEKGFGFIIARKDGEEYAFLDPQHHHHQDY